MNGEIRDREIRVISSSGDMLGVMSAAEALRLAEEENLDLVKISPAAVPPVCKIMNYGKFKFEQAKREKENRKNQKVVEIKEIYLSMTIDGRFEHQGEKSDRVSRRREQSESFHPHARQTDGAFLDGRGRNEPLFRDA